MNTMNTKILLYSTEAYKNYYQDEFVVEFQHNPLATGQTNKEEAEKIVGLLNLFTGQTSNISFLPEMITSDQLTGGACSAIALRVAKCAIELMDRLRENTQFSVFQKEQLLFSKIRTCIEEINIEALSNKQEYDLRKKETRTFQQAFNCIAVDRNMKTNHVVKDKMNSLASYYHLHITESTLEISEKENLEMTLNQNIKELKPGVYLMRVIDYKYNHKLENQGHTATYIKTEHSQYYFDPALGFYMLFNESSKKHLVYHALQSAQLKFKVDQLSFHKLESRSPQEYLEKINLLDPSSFNSHFVSQAFDIARVAENKGDKLTACGIRKKAIRSIETASPKSQGFQVITPELTGSYGVGVARFYLEYVDFDEEGSRHLEIEVHYPALKQSEAKHKILNLVDQNRIFGSNALSRSQIDLKPINEKKFPVLIFSPGLGNSPHDYSHLIEEAASHGFCVIAINHPGSCLFNRFLGSVQSPLPQFEEKEIIHEGLKRAKDIEFVVNQMKTKQIQEIEELLGDAIDCESIGAMGHSLGGSASVHACRSNSSIKAAVDIDGRIIPSSSTKEMTQPVLLFTATLEKNREEFEKAYENFKFQNQQILRKNVNARHGDFSLAPSYRTKNKGKLNQELTAEVAKEMIEFFKKNLI